MKKRTVFLSAFLALDIVLLAVSGWMFFRASQAGAQPQGFHPIVTNADENVRVGKMRMPKMVTDRSEFGSCASPAGIEVRDYVPAGQTYNGQDLEEGCSSLVLWVKDPEHNSSGKYDYTIYRYCEEDGFWYQLYLTSFAFPGSYIPGDEWDKYYQIPSDVLEVPGKYIIELKTGDDRIGGCTFELPLSQPEAQGGSAQ